VKLIVGLGNPGKQYMLTRHNIGFLVIDQLAAEHSLDLTLKGFDAVYGRGKIHEIPVLLVKPQTFMNRSGFTVSRLFDFFKISDCTDVIVVHDDLDLPYGKIRLKLDGGHGGHKGLLSTMEQLGRSDFLRVRMGIGRPDVKMSTENYVLGRFSEEETKLLTKVTVTASDAITELLSSGVQAAMNKYNVRSINNFIEEV
jgi:peptidyl-tRNA hydrolase, PTH1 family